MVGCLHRSQSTRTAVAPAPLPVTTPQVRLHPQSTSRVNAPGAHSCASVENTSGPSGACTAICAVSWSRFRQSEYIRSWRNIERSPRAKVKPPSRTPDLVDAQQLILHRVLNRDDLPIRVVNLVQRRVERRSLAAAGRAGDQDDACGIWSTRRKPSSSRLSMPSSPSRASRILPQQRRTSASRGASG